VIPRPNTSAPFASPNYPARFILLSLPSRNDAPELLAFTKRESPPWAYPAMSALHASTVERRGSSALCSSVVTCSELRAATMSLVATPSVELMVPRATIGFAVVYHALVHMSPATNTCYHIPILLTLFSKKNEKNSPLQK